MFFFFHLVCEDVFHLVRVKFFVFHLVREGVLAVVNVIPRRGE